MNVPFTFCNKQPKHHLACIVGVREGVIAPFLVFATDDGFKTVCQMKWVISITLPQSESTTSELYSAPLCLGLNTKVDI